MLSERKWYYFYGAILVGLIGITLFLANRELRTTNIDKNTKVTKPELKQTGSSPQADLLQAEKTSTSSSQMVKSKQGLTQKSVPKSDSVAESKVKDSFNKLPL